MATSISDLVDFQNKGKLLGIKNRVKNFTKNLQKSKGFMEQYQKV